MYPNSICRVLLILIISLYNQEVFSRELFEVAFEWNYINYTWLSEKHYSAASVYGKYNPENVVIAGIKLYKEKLFLTTPKLRPGVPVSLSYIPLDSKDMLNNPLIPYPNWEINDDCVCGHIQSVQSMEIDPFGIMWVIDGVRVKFNTNCPCKLLLLDLNDSGKVIHSYVFPNEVCLQSGGYLNDIVLDGEYAYMTDSSSIDPGLIVYSRTQNRAWKLRDSTMFSERDAPKFSIDGSPVSRKMPIDGIALSPKPTDESVSRLLFYRPITGYSLFSIPTRALKNRHLYRNGDFRKGVKLVGKTRGATDGMMMDNSGNLFSTLVSHNAVSRWNINTPFDSATILYQNNETMIWPDSFGMNQNGYLYMTSNHMWRFLDTNVELKLSSNILFRVLKFRTGTKSYLYE